MVYQRLNKVPILPKSKLTLELTEKVLKVLTYLQKNLLVKVFLQKSCKYRVYHCNFFGKLTPAQFELWKWEWRLYALFCDPKLMLH